jgi:hypothetical protein
VDQIQSNIPGIFSQMKGTPTRNLYTVITIFVDSRSDVTYIHPQQTSSSIDTLIAKHTFERWSASYERKIKHYHSDNGRFVDNEWTNDCNKQQQTVSMCGFNAHHQNGIVERSIRQLQDMSRTALLHASTMWPDAINTYLWPYAMRNACDDINKVAHHDKEKSPIEQFSGVNVRLDIHNNHVFGCPVFVLNSSLQQGHKISKWDAGANLGIYLGQSLIHASSVALVLSLRTGITLPSFHNTFDDKFEIVTNPFQKYIPKSEWQIICGFKADAINSIHMIPTASEGDSIQEKDIGTKIDNITIQNNHTQYNEFDILNDDDNKNHQETITSEGDRNPTQINSNYYVENIDNTKIITTR